MFREGRRREPPRSHAAADRLRSERRLLQGARRQRQGDAPTRSRRRTASSRRRTIRIRPAATRRRSRGSRRSRTRTTCSATTRSATLYDQIPRGRRRLPDLAVAVAAGCTTTAGSAGPGVFDLGDLFSQFFSERRPLRGAAVGGSASSTSTMTGRPRRQRARATRAATSSSRARSRPRTGPGCDVEGPDVHSDVRISFDRAILGTVATVATVDGKAEVKSPAGDRERQEAAAPRQGRAPIGQGSVGDHYVTVQIDVPSDLDDDSKKLLIQLVTRLRKRGHND